jgi:hypothetical protein
MTAALFLLGLLWPTTIFYAAMAAFAAFDSPLGE